MASFPGTEMMERRSSERGSDVDEHVNLLNDDEHEVEIGHFVHSSPSRTTRVAGRLVKTVKHVMPVTVTVAVSRVSALLSESYASHTSGTTPKGAMLLALRFIISILFPWTKDKTTKLHQTAYLDGLRGVAALIVVFHHWKCAMVGTLLEGYGTGTDNEWFLQMPFVRVVHSGTLSVKLFYTLSGLVLSSRALKLARDGKKSEFASAMASSIFRRWFRLMLPVAASMLLAMFISRSELWAEALPTDWATAPYKHSLKSAIGLDHLTGRSSDFVWFPNPAKMAPRLDSLSEQLWTVLRAVQDTSDIFRNGAAPSGVTTPYDAGGILWTIPAEWYGSMTVFLVVTALAFARRWIRIFFLVLMTWWAYHTGHDDVGLFLEGIILADSMLSARSTTTPTAAEDSLPSFVSEKQISTRWTAFRRALTLIQTPKIMQAFYVGLFLFGMFLGSQPYLDWDKVQIMTGLIYDIPDWFRDHADFYPCLGATFMMISITRCTLIQNVFNTGFAQYFGRIGFSLYLTHCQVLWVVGLRVFPWTMNLVGGGLTQAGFGAGMLLGTCIALPVTLWVADLFCHAVDEKSVTFGRWLGKKCLTI